MIVRLVLKLVRDLFCSFQLGRFTVEPDYIESQGTGKLML